MFTLGCTEALRPVQLPKEESDIVQRFKNDPEEILLIVYRDYRREFFSWAYTQFGADEAMAADCFQDALIVLHNNIRTGKLAVLSCSLKTYVFAIGKNLLMKRFQFKKKELPLDDHVAKIARETRGELSGLYEGNEMENVIAGLVEGIKDPCRSILKYFYYRGFSMEDIANAMKYKNAQTVKAQKVRCIKELQRRAKAMMAKTSIQ